MKAFDYIPLYTYTDYKLWEGNWELINGYPHAMSPSPNRKHQIFYSEISSAILQKLKQNSTECNHCRIYQDLDWIINEDTVVRPDIMIVCGEFKDDFLKFPPVLIIEVLSKSTSMKDRNIKFKLYELQKVKYYILVNPENNLVEQFELINSEYQPQQTSNSFLLHSNCILNLDINAVVQSIAD